MQNYKKNFVTRTLAWVLAAVMVIAMVPVGVFAEEDSLDFGPEIEPTAVRAVDKQGKPLINWEEDQTAQDDGKGYWPLPSNVKIVKGQKGADPLNTLGFTYLGRYYDQNGRIVLKFEVSHRNQSDSSVWDRFVMRFPNELFQKIDTEASYVLWKQTEVFSINNFDTLIASDVREQSANCLQFPYRNVGAQYCHREVNIVLKSNTNWDDTFAQKTQEVQLRLYNGNNDKLKIFSTAGGYKGADYAALGYNTYTKTAIVGDLSKRPKDLMEATTKSMTRVGGQNDQFHSADSALQLDRDDKKVRLIYTFGSDVIVPRYLDGDKFAIRQTLDRDFIKYLDLGNKGKTNEEKNRIGSVWFLSENETPVGTKLPIYASYINGLKLKADGSAKLDAEGNPEFNRDDRAVFIQFAETGYESKDNPDSSDPNYVNTIKTNFDNILRTGNQDSGSIMVFEYNIDPEKINENLVKDKKLTKNFMFDTRYILSNGKGVRKYTTTTTEEIVIQPNKQNFFAINFKPYVSISSGMGSSAEMQDFVLNIGGSEGIWKSWKREGHAFFPDTNDYAINMYGWQFYMKKYNIKTGMTIKAGTPITVYLPNLDYGNKGKYPDSIDFDIVTGERKLLSGDNLTNKTSLTGNNVLRLDKVTKADGSDIFYPPMYFKNSVSTVGATAMIEKFVPIVDEIFTDSKEFTGIMKNEGGVSSSLYLPEKATPKQYLGQSFISTEENKNGDITAYLRSDGKENAQSFAVKKDDTSDIFEKRTYDKKEYEGFAFNIKKQYFGAESVKFASQSKNVEKLGLLKDQPIVFATYSETSLKSEPVIEQVQAKVEFVTYPAEKVSFTRIVPLNTEYSVIAPVAGEEIEPKKNENYKPNGFVVKQGEDNIRVDENDKTVTLARRSIVDDKDKNKKYPNLINHDGFVYDINNEAERNAFIKRLYPDAEFDKEIHTDAQGKDRTDGLSVIGWTTKPVANIDEFYQLEKDGKVLTDVKQWKDVEDNTQNYIFNEYSPVDKNRKVYAVWGAPSLVLHSNNTYDAQGNFEADKETIVRIPYSLADETLTNQKIDQMTSATKDNLRKTNTIKQLPLAPYKYESNRTVATTDENYDNYDERLENFRMSGRTFVGWTMKQFSNITDADKYDESKLSEFVAGQNNVRIGEIKDGWTTEGPGKPKVSLPKNTETIELLQTDTKAYVPNGFAYSVNKGVEAVLKAGKDYHLYANYRDYFDITVRPQYKDIDTTQDPTHKYGKYKDLTDASKKKSLKVGILYRTAVTDYTTPTVLQQATYNPIKDGIKEYDVNFAKPLTWKQQPGYDREGLRKSFISVVIPEGKENVYNNFKQPKTPGSQEVYDWADLGISTYVKLNGKLFDIATNAPKNLHETDTDRDRYGDPLAKRQSFTIKNGDGSLDAYTSATSRQSLVREVGALKEVKGYDIILTNTPETIPVPEFESVKESDTELKIKFSDDIKNNVDGLKLEIPQKNDGKLKLDFKKKTDGTFEDSNGIKAVVEGDHLVIKTLDLTGLPDDEQKRTIYGNYTKAIDDGSGTKTNIDGKQSKVVITKLLPAYPVTNMYQVPNDDQGNTMIKFDIPQPDPKNQVVPGTKYQPQKWDTTKNKWVNCGDPYNVTKTGEGGKPVELKLVGVGNKDMIRIVSDEPGKKPAYSVGDETDTPYTPMKPAKPSDPVADTNHYVIVDRQAPEVTATTKEEKFRRYIDLTATLDELPEGEIIIEYGTKGPKGTQGNQILKFENKALAFEKIKELVRVEDKTEIWITAKDRFGNSADTDVTATLTRVFTIQVEVPASGDTYLMIKPSMDNAKVEMTIKRKGQETVLKAAENLEKNKYNEVKLLTTNDQPFELEKGDTIIFKGTVNATDGKADYTTNPFRMRVRR